MRLIAKHLDKNNLKIPVIAVPEGSICAFTGKPIEWGVRNEDLIKVTFTDHVYLRYPSDYSSVDIALCIEAVLPGNKGLVSLRNFSYYASEKELKLLSRENILDLMRNIPDVPFVLVVTYSNKKHTAFKTRANYSSRQFTVTTDKEAVVPVDIDRIERYLPVLQQLYAIIPGKETSKQQPTWFTKDEALTGHPPLHKVQAFGLERWEELNEALMPYRNTSEFQLVIHLLNKST